MTAYEQDGSTSNSPKEITGLELAIAALMSSISLFLGRYFVIGRDLPRHFTRELFMQGFKYHVAETPRQASNGEDLYYLVIFAPDGSKFATWDIRRAAWGYHPEPEGYLFLGEPTSTKVTIKGDIQPAANYIITAAE